MKITPALRMQLLASAYFVSTWLTASTARASSYQVLHEFGGPGDGLRPLAGLTEDSEGRLYGTTSSGGACNAGIVFRLTKSSDGSVWNEEILHSFYCSMDGSTPSSPLTLGPSGEIYGTTVFGGGSDFGTVFRLDNLPGWPLMLLHSFGNSPDGRFTVAGVVFGANGLLYGSTSAYSLKGDGMAFSVSPLGDATEYAIIDKFGNGPGGKYPSQLVATDEGKLYGTALNGGTLNGGTAFYLSLDSKGGWRQRTLYNFGAPGDVVNPANPLLIGLGALEGSLFGCELGGSHGMGAVVRLQKPLQAQSLWTETILYNFGDQPSDPVVHNQSTCGLTQDPSGKLFGTASAGGVLDPQRSEYGGGVLFEVDPPAAGGTAWSEHVLHNFGGSTQAAKGNYPNSPPLRVGGVFYGTTYTTDGGGLGNPGVNPAGGVVWKYTP